MSGVFRKPLTKKKPPWMPHSVAGSVIISPTAVDGIGAVVDPTVVLGSMTITTTPAAGIGVTIDPTVIGGSVTITPTPAASVVTSIDPTVLLGSTIATPDAASAIGAVYGPVVIGGVGGDLIDIYTASLAAAFSGSAGTICAWLKIYDADTWSDSSNRYVIRIAVDDDNQVYLMKTGNAGELKWGYVAGGTAEEYAEAGHDELTWLHMAITWDKIQDEVKYYLDGIQVSTTQSSLGTWAGALASDKCVIGAMDNTGVSVWYGWMAHVALWSKALSGRQVLWISRENMS